MERKIRVLITDDSSLIRSMLRSFFESDRAFAVVGEASTGQEAVNLVRELRPDLVTMDIEMPGMGGLEAIEVIMATSAVPILVVSSIADAHIAYEAVARGAIDVISKPGIEQPAIDGFLATCKLVSMIPVITHIRALRVSASERSGRQPAAGPEAIAASPVSSGNIFAIASSTGGPQALATILRKLPPGFRCPILISQHIADGFSAGMATWLATLCPLPVQLAREGEPILMGTVYLSQSESHLTVSRGCRFSFVNRLRTDIYHPSCDTLLGSVAAVYGRRSIGIILTGMGSDGVKGMEKIFDAGGRTIAQDEASSVIFGMNRVAIESGWIQKVAPLEKISGLMFQMSQDQVLTQTRF